MVAGKHLPSMTSKAGSESEPVGGGEAMPPGPPPALAPGPPPADILPLSNFLLKLLLFPKVDLAIHYSALCPPIVQVFCTCFC